MTTDNAKRIQDLTAQTRTALDQWEKQVLDTAGKYDAGTLTADDMVAAWTSGAKLAMTGFATLASSFLDVPTGAGNVIASSPYPVERTKKFKNVPVTVTVTGPLTATVAKSEIPANEVRIRPSPNLESDVMEFRIEVTTAGRKVGNYEGTVEINDGKQTDVVNVSIDVK